MDMAVMQYSMLLLVMMLTVVYAVNNHQPPLNQKPPNIHMDQHDHRKAFPPLEDNQPHIHHNKPFPKAQEGDARYNRLRDRNMIHESEHIMDHLDGVVNKPTDEMSEEELQFHYFKLHDYDNNNKLDGIELTSAITHFHKEDHSAGETDPVLSDNEVESMVDMILKEEDDNNDGYIDYPEFKRSQDGRR